MFETVLDAEICERFRGGWHDLAGRGWGNSCNGTRATTVLTEIGSVEIELPGDTSSTFDPQIVNKCRRLRSLSPAQILSKLDDRYDPPQPEDRLPSICPHLIRGRQP